MASVLDSIVSQTAKDCAVYGWRDLMNAKLQPECDEFEIEPQEEITVVQSNRSGQDSNDLQINSSVDSTWKPHMCQPWDVDYNLLKVY